MKHLFTLLIIFGLGLSSFGQIEKGRQFQTGGGSLSFTHISNPERDIPYNDVGIGLNTGYGFFITDNIALGSNIGGSFAYTTNSAGGKFITLSGGFSLFGQHYKSITEKLYFTNRISIRGGIRKMTNQIPPGFSNRSYSYGATYQPGLTYLYSSKLGLDLRMGHLQWTQSKEEFGDDYRTRNDFTFRLLGSLGFGITYFLG